MSTPSFLNRQIRPLGGGLGCLPIILFSIVASVVLTLVLNLVAHLPPDQTSS